MSIDILLIAPDTMNTPPRRQRIHDKSRSHSPAIGVADDDGRGTPGPTRVRIHNLEKQVQELVRKYHAEKVSPTAEIVY